MFLVKNLTNMKKITLAFVSLLLIQVAHAQVSKGSLFTGGSVNVNSTTIDNSFGSTTNTSKTSGWSVSPQIGTAIQQNKIIGVQLFAGGNSSENTSNNVSKGTNNNYGVGIFYRQYFPIASKWMLFGQAAVLGNFGNGESSSQGIKTDKSSSWGIGLGITPGIAYQAGKKVWLEASLSNLLGINYSSQKTDNLSQSGSVTSTSKRKDFSANANWNGFNNINLGIRWIIPKS